MASSTRLVDMARSTRLVTLTKNLYIYFIRVTFDSASDPDQRKRFPLPATYFPTNKVHPFTLRVTQYTVLLYE